MGVGSPVQQAPCSWSHRSSLLNASDAGSPDGQVGCPSTCDGHTKNKHSLWVKVPESRSHALLGLWVSLPDNSPLPGGGKCRVPDEVNTHEPNPWMRHPSGNPTFPCLVQRALLTLPQCALRHLLSAA